MNILKINQSSMDNLVAMAHSALAVVTAYNKAREEAIAAQQNELRLPIALALEAEFRKRVAGLNALKNQIKGEP